MTTRRTCYHCRAREAARYSNFCECCLTANRPPHFPRDEKEPTPLLTRFLWLGAFASLVWLVFKTAQYVMQ